MSIPGCVAIGLVLALSPGCISWRTGLDPIDPPGVVGPDAPVVDSLRPTLTWESSPLEGDPDVESLRYVLQVFRFGEGPALRPAPENIDYERDDLRQSFHTLETALEPRTTYLWRVCTVHVEGGEAVVGDWNGYTKLFLLYPIGDTSFDYAFRTPAAEDP